MPASQHSISIHFVRSLLHSAHQLELDNTRLILNANLSPAQLHNPQTRVTPEQLSALLRAIWQQADDEFMGMASHPCRFGVFSLLAKQLVHCRTLGQVYRHISRFYRLTSPALTLSLHSNSTQSRFRLQLSSGHQDLRHSLREFLLLLWHRFPSWLIGQRIPLQQISLDYPVPKHQSEYPLLYPCPAVFNQPECALHFDRDWLRQPVVQTATTLKDYLRQAPADWFRPQACDPVFSRRVIDLLTTAETPGQLKMPQAADALHITTRTLRRKLQDEGTSFQTLKDNIRRDTAIHLLSQSTTSISQISRQLGFSEPAAFTRAFQQWTGQSPGSYRQRQD